MTKIPIVRKDDGELLGFIAKDSTSWTAQTMFGYIFSRSEERSDAEDAVRSQGLSILQGLWQYFDKDEKAWFPCILKEAYEGKVKVIRTNAMGYQDPDDYKVVTIVKPTEVDLIKS